jgi:hypothetical protein
MFVPSDKYLAAALFAGQQLYNASPVPFSYYGPEGNWFITPLAQIPSLGYGNASISANLSVITYGINTSSGCEMASNITFGSNSIVTASLNGCSFDFAVDLSDNVKRWHNASSIPCNSSASDSAFNTFIYSVYRPLGYLSSDPSQFVVMFCQPQILIAKLFATLAVSSQGTMGALVKPPEVIESFPIGSNTNDLNVTPLLGPPLNGMAINGYDIAEAAGTSDLSRAARVNVTRSILYEGIYGALLDHLPTDIVGQPSNDWCM